MERGLIAILDFLAEDGATAALAGVDRIEAAARRLRDFPLSGRPVALAGTRELLVPGLPYLLIYRVRETAVEVLRVLHGAPPWPPAGGA